MKAKDIQDNEKRMQIINKEEMKDILGRSPDFADAMMMRCWFDLGQPSVTASEDYEVSIEW